ncbi:hypothetical protein ABQF26_44000, partial [Mycolicibacterium elephantis]
ELYGETVAEGSVMLLINGSANRDERQYPDADRFDIHRLGVLGWLSWRQRKVHWAVIIAFAGLITGALDP